MTSETSNDNHTASVRSGIDGPDAHGQAAMLLVESLIHGLIARSVITVAEAVEIVGIAAEVKEDIAVSLGDSPATMRKSLTLLQAITDSLESDIPRE